MSAEQLDVAVLGAGYVGLVFAASVSTLGCRVRLIDRDSARIEGLRSGIVPFFEPGLAEAVRAGVAADRLVFVTNVDAARGAAAVFIAVGTLDQRGDWSAHDVNLAVNDICADASLPRTIVVRSTLMPGATARLVASALERDPSVEIALNPEFTRQGSAMNDFLHPDRVVIGLTRPEQESSALRALRQIYDAIGAPLVVTDAASAELIKVGSNVMLALKAGFANEIARLSAAVGADVATVVDGIGLDRRIGRSYLTPGPGFGGSCLPSQSRSVPAAAYDHGVSTPIMDAIDSSNAQQAGWVVDVLERAIGDLPGKRVCVLGLTFKAGTDDVRESPALRVCRALAGRGATIAAHDPMGARAATVAAERDGYLITTCDSPLHAAGAADAVVVTTDWPEYGALDWSQIADAMGGRVVVDTRAVVDPAAAQSAGLEVIVLGRTVLGSG